MTTTLEEFCDGLMADDHPMERLEPEGFAAEFSAYFQLPACRGLNRLAELFERTGIGKVSPAKLPGTLRGVHYTLPDGSYAIHYQEGQWEGSSEYTLLHEGYEIVYETLWDRCHDEAPERKVCSGGGPVRGGGADAPGDLRRLRPGQRAGRGDPAPGCSVVLTRRWPSAWARCCALNSWRWSCTSGKRTATPRPGNARRSWETCGPRW